MAATLKWHGEKAKRAYKTEAAERLLAALKELQKLAKEAFGKAYPPASKPGQYPRKRTGNLVRNLIIVPNTAAEIVRRQLHAGLGYGRRAPYGKILEDHRARLGLKEIVKRNKKVLAAALSGKGAMKRGAR